MTLSDQEVYDLLQYMHKLDNNPNFLQKELDTYANERISNRHVLTSDDLFASDVL